MSLMSQQLPWAVVPTAQSRPVQELTIGVGSAVGDAVGPCVGEPLDGVGDAEPDEPGEQLASSRAPTASRARRVVSLCRIMSSLPAIVPEPVFATFKRAAGGVPGASAEGTQAGPLPARRYKGAVR
jgi:hypothetical protein